MFLRRKRKAHRGECYEYWALCESVRTPHGPRQRVVATLGKLTSEEPEEEAGWDELQELLEGAPRPAQLSFGSQEFEKSKAAEAERWELVEVNQMRVERTREFGRTFLGLALWHRLGLHRLLAELMEPGGEEVPWAVVACILTVARFCAQTSELAIAERWYAHSAMEDLIGVPWTKINDDRLYRGLDVLLGHKEQMCRHLMERYHRWFGLQFEFLIYDVTSTYFEGQALSNFLAQRGHSRDKRPDCKQVCIGLVCTPEGLPLSFELFAGNRSDVTTVEHIVDTMESKYGKAGRVWVMDRGMVSQHNIEFLSSRGVQYVVGMAKSQLKRFAAQLEDPGGWTQVEAGVEAKLVEDCEGEAPVGERYIVCRSAARAEKERAMLQRQREGLGEALGKIGAALRKHPCHGAGKLEELQRRIGRAQGKYPAAAKLIEVRVVHNPEGSAVDLLITEREEGSAWREKSHGVYVLRTNCSEKNPARLWRWYMQLTQAEAAFRTAKSDLKLRPLHHQLAHRVEAHILVCFLALALWRTLEQWMYGKNLGNCARRLVEEVATIQSMDVVLPIRRGDQRAQLRVRTVARPERRVAELLQQLGLQLPRRNRILEDVPEPAASRPTPMEM